MIAQALVQFCILYHHICGLKQTFPKFGNSVSNFCACLKRCTDREIKCQNKNPVDTKVIFDVKPGSRVICDEWIINKDIGDGVCIIVINNEHSMDTSDNTT